MIEWKRHAHQLSGRYRFTALHRAHRPVHRGTLRLTGRIDGDHVSLTIGARGHLRGFLTKGLLSLESDSGAYVEFRSSSNAEYQAAASRLVSGHTSTPLDR